ncbi:MAG: gliding motility protein GldL [Paludibacteraceae bacterium]
MATEEQVAQKRGPWAKFMHWYESYNGKFVVNIVYSVGASVVIVGALFKILHWPGASQVLMLGMFTEAFLFLIGTLEKPHPEFHWENVFPQLLGYGTKPELLEEKSHQPRPTLLGAGTDGSAPEASASGAPIASRSAVPSLNEGEMAALKDGITDLAKTAAQLSELGKIATSTSALGTKLAAAGEAADKFVAGQDTLLNASNALGQQFASAAGKLETSADNLSAHYVSVSDEMQKVVAATQGYRQNVEGVGAKLTALNSIYELQINAIQAQVDACKTQTTSLSAISANVQAMQVAAAEAQKSQEAYSAASSKLAKQLADLNRIYGNMLNALA